MANRSGGVLAIGIEEPAVNGQPFVKSGFEPGRKNTILADIGNYSHKVEPHPTIDHREIDDTNGKFYIIVKVGSRATDIPYAIKDKGQFYVRVGASSRPASRNTVLNMFSGMREKVRDVERLRASVVSVKNSYIHLSQLVGKGDYGSWQMFPLLDLSFVKNAILEADWFLVETGLLGEIAESGGGSGMHVHLRDLEQMNTYIKAFNETFEPSQKQHMDGALEPHAKGRSGYTAMIPFLEGVIKECDKFLTEHSS